MKLRLHTFDLLLRHEFTISRGSLTVQPTLIVELAEGNLRGFGEATSNTYYGATLASMQSSLEAIRGKIETTTWTDPREFWQSLNADLQHDRFAQCALDQAAFDLWGKRHNSPVYEMLGLSIDQAHLPRSNYTIGIDTIENMKVKLREFPGWPIYKIKLGTDRDLDIIRALRAETNAVFRVDANCGWSAEATLETAVALKSLSVEFIEQPLEAGDIDGMKKITGHCALPIIADEDCQQESDVDRCAEMGFDGINIKLVKCGGMTPAIRMIERARALKLRVMIGCMTESSVGISAIAQLLPLLDYVDMDGAVLLAQDIATGVTVDKGICHFAAIPGNGVKLLP